jgi:hypothetical protein
MTAFRFIFPDDDEGFELVEEEVKSADLVEDEEEETTQIDNQDDVIWETEEDYLAHQRESRPALSTFG